MNKQMTKSVFNRGIPGRYEVKNLSDGTASTEVFIYDEIGWLGVSAEDFVKDFKNIEGDVVIRVNSPGGSVFDGIAMYNTIKEHKGKVTVKIDGLAASAASFIPLAADEVHINDGAFIMIHEAWTVCCGNADDFVKEAALLEKIDGEIAGFYATRTGKTEGEIREYLSDETWFTATEALEFGLVDKIIERKEKSEAQNLFDLSVYGKVPEQLFESEGCETQKPKDYEKALRDAGMTRQQAKAVLSGGLKTIEEQEKPDQPKVSSKDRDITEAEFELASILLC